LPDLLSGHREIFTGLPIVAIFHCAAGSDGVGYCPPVLAEPYWALVKLEIFLPVAV